MNGIRIQRWRPALLALLGLGSLAACGKTTPPAQTTPESAAIEVEAQATATTGLTGVYYNNADFSGTTVTKIDGTISKSWGTAKPANGIDATTYSVRWTGQITVPVDATYSFYLTSSGGAKLWVNNQVFINDSGDHASKTVSATLNLNAGQKYDIRLDYTRINNPGAVKLEWSRASQTRGIIPQTAFTPTGSNAPASTGVSAMSNLLQLKGNISVAYTVSSKIDVTGLKIVTPFATQSLTTRRGMVDVVGGTGAFMPVYLMDGQDRIRAITHYATGMGVLTFSNNETARALVLRSLFARATNAAGKQAIRNALERSTIDLNQRFGNIDFFTSPDLYSAANLQVATDIALELINQLAPTGLSTQSIDRDPAGDPAISVIENTAGMQTVSFTHINKGPVTYMIAGTDGFRSMTTGTNGFTGVSVLDAVWGAVVTKGQTEHVPNASRCSKITVSYSAADPSFLVEGGEVSPLFPAVFQNIVAFVQSAMEVAGIDTDGLIDIASVVDPVTVVYGIAGIINRANNDKLASPDWPTAWTEATGLVGDVMDVFMLALAKKGGEGIPSGRASALENFLTKGIRQEAARIGADASSRILNAVIPIRIANAVTSLGKMASIGAALKRGFQGKPMTAELTVDPCYPEIKDLTADPILLRAYVGETAQGKFSFSNGGYENSHLRYRFASPDLALSFTPPEGDLPHGNQANIIVTRFCDVSTSYDTSIFIESNDPYDYEWNHIVRVRVECLPKLNNPKIQAPNQINIQGIVGQSASGSFEVSNVGDAESKLDYQIISSTGVNTSPSQGSISNSKKQNIITSFYCDSPKTTTGLLSINSNDPDSSTKSIVVNIKCSIDLNWPEFKPYPWEGTWRTKAVVSYQEEICRHTVYNAEGAVESRIIYWLDYDPNGDSPSARVPSYSAYETNRSIYNPQTTNGGQSQYGVLNGFDYGNGEPLGNPPYSRLVNAIKAMYPNALCRY